MELMMVLRKLAVFARYIGQRFVQDGCLQSAAALTYTTLFAVVPLMTVTYSMLAAIPTFQGVGDEIQSFIFSNFVPSAGATVQSYLADFSTQARKLTFVGVAFLIVTALLMLKTIEEVLNKIWRVEQGRKGLASFLLYWAILSLGPLLLGCGFALTSYITSVELIMDATDLIISRQWLLQIVPPLLTAAAFCLIYIAVPNRPVRFKHALLGGLLAAALFELAKKGFALFVSLSPSYELVYGAFAAVPLFLLWIYLSWNIILLGAELVRALNFWHDLQTREPLPTSLAVIVIAEVFRERFQQGLTTSYQHMHQANWPVSQEQWELCTKWLHEQGIITKDDSGELILGHDLALVNCWSFCRSIPWQLPSENELSRIQQQSWPDWLGFLVARIAHIHHYAEQQLPITLTQLFDYHSGNQLGFEDAHHNADLYPSSNISFKGKTVNT
ncbi:YihY family inner membrane protein [Zooshikella ganghwensis]|nr:YihY family inner membrane protein [Zooshikella ganghwensis]